MEDSRSYEALGASSAKTGIYTAISSQDKGLFHGSFCKIIPDVLAGDPNYCLALHSDGTGTKSIVAYLLYNMRQNSSHTLENDPSIFSSLAQDALVMNTDDLLCIGATGPFIVSNTIGRNRFLIDDKIVQAIIEGYSNFASTMALTGIGIYLSGGETADIGDLVRTLVVDASVFCRLKRKDVIDGSRVVAGDVIIGLASDGVANYETYYNSGIGSNGLTLARHVLLKGPLRDRFPEVSEPSLNTSALCGYDKIYAAYRGQYCVTDYVEELGMTVGHALLSPTRTYAPVIKRVLEHLDERHIHAIVHCTGGGQTKCAGLNTDVSFIKNDMFSIPPIFKLIQKASGLSSNEMYQVFNMGHRMELIVDPTVAHAVINISKEFGVEAKEIGFCTTGPEYKVAIQEGSKLLRYYE